MTKLLQNKSIIKFLGIALSPKSTSPTAPKTTS